MTSEGPCKGEGDRAVIPPVVSDEEANNDESGKLESGRQLRQNGATWSCQAGGSQPKSERAGRDLAAPGYAVRLALAEPRT